MTSTATDDATPPLPPTGDEQASEGRGSPVVPRDRRFYTWLLGITLAGFAWRLFYVAVFQHDLEIWGDGYFYHHAANLLADGEGWINPYAYNIIGTSVEAADHPPLYILYLAGFSALGFEGPLAHMVASTFIGAATIWIAGLAGRQIGGARLGLIGAVLVAIYPNIWNWDGLLLSETMAIFGVTLTIWLGYRFWRRPGLWAGAALGAAVGVATLSRAELLLLSVLVVLPLCLWARRSTWRERLTWLVGAALACTLVLTPWVAHNMTRFENPVLLSNGLEVTLVTANCPDTFYGEGLGYWSWDCLQNVLRENNFDEATDDQSRRAQILGDAAYDYLSSQKSRLPVVVLARWGRTTNLWIPLDQVALDIRNERMTPWVPRAGLVMWYPLVALAIVGGVLLRRRRVALVPLLGAPIVVAVVVTIFFGQARYRAVAEVSIALLAAVAVERIWTWWPSRRSDGPDAEVTPEHRAVTD